MKRRGWTAALSACLAVLVALLAGLQWRWLQEIEGTEHFRRDSRIRSSCWSFKTIFEREINQLALQMAAPTRGGVPADELLAERLESWRQQSRWPGLVAALYRVEGAPEGGGLALARLDFEPAEHSAPVPWLPELEPLTARLAELSLNLSPAAPATYHVEPSIPAILVPAATWSWPSLLIVLDRSFMAEQMLPEIVQMVFPPPSFFGLEVAVAEAESGRVVFSNLDIDHAAQFGPADSVLGLVRDGAEPIDIWAIPPLLRPGVSGPRPGVTLVPPSQQWQPNADDEAWFGELWAWSFYTGHWRLLMRDGVNPLVDQAAAVRTRRAVTASVLLALLATTIALLTVVTRRTQRAAREQMEQLARVSHELRTPLTVLASAGDNLADGVARDEGKTRQYGELIQKETQRLLEQVENVLHLSRRRAGAAPAARQRVDLVALVAGSLAVAEPGLRESGYTVERSLPPHPVEIEGSPRALSSALLNLVSNAAKHGGPCRWLRVAVAGDEGGEARIVVEDRGPGIPAQEVPRIFQAYARGARATADQIEGSGLGLAVVLDVATAHGGRVTVANPAAGGAAFTLHLPLALER